MSAQARLVVRLLYLFYQFLFVEETCAWSPVANSAAVVLQPSQDGQSAVRITVLSPSLIRIEQSFVRQRDLDGSKNQNFSFLDSGTQAVINRLRDVPVFHVSRPLATLLELFTSNLQLIYDFSGDGAINASTLSITVLATENTWKPGLDPLADGQSLLGVIRTLDWVSHGLARGVKPEMLPYPQWLNCSFMNNAQTFNNDQCLERGANCSNFCQWGVAGRAGWALVVDDTPLMDDRLYPYSWPSGKKSVDSTDFYFFGHGHNFAEALYDYTQTFGLIPLPPRHTFGILASGWHRWTIDDFHQRVFNYTNASMPLDGFVLDMDWHVEGPWGSYTWDPDLMSEHFSLVNWMHSIDLSASVNLHDNCGVTKSEEQYPYMSSALKLQGMPNLGFQIWNETWANAFLATVIEGISVDFLWPDYQFSNQSPLWAPQTAFWINHLYSTRNIRASVNKRTLVLSRFAGLGGHRYPFGFVGDDVGGTDQDLIERRIHLAMHSTNAGVGYWTADIFWAKLRVIQNGVYSAMVRFHGYSGCGVDPFCLGGDTFIGKAVSRILLEREALIPYIYTMARFAFDMGLGLVRPMYYQWSELEMSYEVSNANLQYMFGDRMLISALNTDFNSYFSSSEWGIWLPPEEWVDSDTNFVVPMNGSNGSLFSKRYLSTEYPVFVRRGSIIPALPFSLRLLGRAAQQYTSLQLRIAAPSLCTISSDTFELYEDDGVSEDYKLGNYAITTITYSVSSISEMVLSVSTTGTYPLFPALRSYVIAISQVWPAVSVNFGGRSISACNKFFLTNCFRYLGDSLTVEVVVAEQPTLNEMSLKIQFQTLPAASVCTPQIPLKGIVAHAVLGLDAYASGGFAPTPDVINNLQSIVAIPAQLEAQALEPCNMTAFVETLNSAPGLLHAAHQAATKAYPTGNFMIDVTSSSWFF